MRAFPVRPERRFSSNWCGTISGGATAAAAPAVATAVATPPIYCEVVIGHLQLICSAAPASIGGCHAANFASAVRRIWSLAPVQDFARAVCALVRHASRMGAVSCNGTSDSRGAECHTRDVRFIIMSTTQDGHCAAGILKAGGKWNARPSCRVSINECLSISGASISQNSSGNWDCYLPNR